MSNRVLKQVALLEKQHSLVAVGCWYRNVVPGLGYRVRRPNASECDIRSSNVFSHGEVLMRRKAYEEVGGYDSAFRYCQDYDLWLRLSECGGLGTVHEVLYDRYIRRDGVSYDPTRQVAQAKFYVCAQRLNGHLNAESDGLRTTLATAGIEAAIGIGDGAVQRRLERAVLRSCMMGLAEEAETLAQSAVISRARRSVLVLLARTERSRLFRPLWFAVRSGLGFRRIESWSIRR